MEMFDAAINLQVWNKKLDSSRGPDTATQSLSHLDETSSVALDGTDGNHDDISVREQLGRMSHSIMHLLGSEINADKYKDCWCSINIELID